MSKLSTMYLWLYQNTLSSQYIIIILLILTCLKIVSDFSCFEKLIKTDIFYKGNLNKLDCDKIDRIDLILLKLCCYLRLNYFVTQNSLFEVKRNTLNLSILNID